VLSASHALRSPTGYLEQKGKALQLLENRLSSGYGRLMDRKKRRYIELTAKLDAMSPLKVLTRGYAMAQTADGVLLRSTAQVAPGDAITVDLSDGRIHATVVSGKEKEDV